MKRRDTLYWIWLSRALGHGSRGLESLIEVYGSPYGIYSTNEIDGALLRGVSKSAIAALSKKDLAEACCILDQCEREEIGVLTYWDEAYPDTLRAIEDPPVVLYYKGRLPDMNQKMCVGMVGTRSMSEYGRDAAYKIAYGLARAGAVIVSGMAEGIDGVCAAAAIAAGGETVAFLGGGADVVYPKFHKVLYEEICRHGAVLSEYPPATKPIGYHFPMRNRLISGASETTLVIEANVQSGSLITAKRAIAQGRSVYALLTTATKDAAAGAQALLERGAKPLIGAGQIISDFIHIYPKTAYTGRDACETVDTDLTHLSKMGVIASKDEKSNLEAKAKSARPVTDGAALDVSVKGLRKNDKSHALAEEELGAMPPVQAAMMRFFLEEKAVPSEQFYSLPYEASEISMALVCLEIAGKIKKTVGSLYELC